MENIGEAIVSVYCSNDSIKVVYSNDVEEVLENNCCTYHKMYETWIKTNDVFITDKYKVEMRHLSLCYLQNNNACSMEIAKFFQPENNENVKNFLNYMRQRNTLLPIDREKWTKVV